MPSLAQLPVGTTARITSLSGPDQIVQRLSEFGLLEGEPVEVIAVAPLGDPIEIRCGGSRLSIRRADAQFILVAE